MKSAQEYEVLHLQDRLLLDALTTDSTPGKDSTVALHDLFCRGETKQASDNQNVVNPLGNLERHKFALYAAAATFLYLQVENEWSQQGFVAKKFIPYKLITILKRPLTTRVGLCDKHFSSVLRRYTFEMSIY